MKNYNLFVKIVLSMFFVLSFFTVSFARGWISDGFDWQYVENDGTYAFDTIKASGDDKYYIDINGKMARDYLLESYDDDIYYFDDTGKMVRNTWVAVDPTQVENSMDNPPTVYLYYFGTSGKAFKARNSVIKKTIDGKKYLFNENGQMLSGWINETGERFDEYNSTEDPFVGYCYYAGDETDGVLREGWSRYEDGSVSDRYYEREIIWFYFKPNDCRKVQSDSSSKLERKKINGKTYAFDDNGVMAAGWNSDMFEDKEDVEAVNYFSRVDKDDAGRLHKKEWVFTVPAASQDLEEHDAEVDRWFYSLGSGEIAKATLKKINKEYYIFDHQGVMRSGLCVIDKNTRKYIDVVDIEKTDGKDFLLTRHYISKGKNEDGTDVYSAAHEYQVFDDTTQVLYYFNNEETDASYGKRILGKVSVAFADDDYTFNSKGAGEYEGYKNKMYYQAGIMLKADSSLSLGAVLVGYASASDVYASNISYQLSYNNSAHPYANIDVNHKTDDGNYIYSDYIVKYAYDSEYYPVYHIVDKNGKKVTKSNVYKKDKNNRYWLIGQNSTLVKVYEMPLKYVKSEGRWYFKSDVFMSNGNTKPGWVLFADYMTGNETEEEKAAFTDAYGKRCYLSRAKQGDYEVKMDEGYMLNFRYVD